jgi:hypothetical protein
VFPTHSSERVHGDGLPAWQRTKYTATSVPCNIRDPHINDIVAVVLFAGRSLRATTHGKDFVWQIGPFAVRFVTRQRRVFP